MGLFSKEDKRVEEYLMGRLMTEQKKVAELEHDCSYYKRKLQEWVIKIEGPRAVEVLNAMQDELEFTREPNLNKE